MDMSTDIQNHVLENLTNRQFVLQSDQSTDISGKTQLLSFIRFICESEISEQYKFCRELETIIT